MAIQFLSSLSVTGSVSVSSVAQDNSSYTGILVWDGSALKYRTKAQILSDIGGGSMSSFSVTNGSTTGSISNGGTLTIAASTGITVGLSGSGGSGNFSITNSDRGSSQNIFKTFAVSGQNSVIADTNSDTMTFAASGGMTITTNSGTDTITFSSANDDTNHYVTSASFSTSNGFLTLNRNGLSAVTVDLDGRYAEGTGSSGRVAFWNGTHALSSDSNLYWNNGSNRLGINTSSPSKSLHVVGEILVDKLDHVQYADADNDIIEFNYSAQNFAMPLNGYLWHDLLAFDYNYTRTQEVYNGSSWSSVTLQDALFSQKQDQSIEVISSSNQKVRWTFQGVSWAVPDWLNIAFTYVASDIQKDILVETSSNGSTWTAINTSTASSGIRTVSCRLAYYGGNSYLRVTVSKNPTSSTNSVRMSSLRLMTARAGDQGQGMEQHFPYVWNSDRYIGINYTNSNQSLSYALDVNGTGRFVNTLRLDSVVNQGGTASKFLVLDGSNQVDFRTASEVLSDIGAGSGSMSSWTLQASSGGTENISNGETVTIAQGTGITTARSGATVTITNSSPDTGLPAITNVSGTPLLTSGITGAEIRSLIGAGTGSGSMSSWNIGDGSTTDSVSNGQTVNIIGGTNITVGASGDREIEITNGITNLNQLTNGPGYITGITINSQTGLTGGGTGTTFNLNLDLNELSTTTSAGNADFFAVVNSGGTQYKIAPGNINNSTFNNNAGFVTSSGVTSVATSNGLTGGTITGTGTLSMSGSYDGNFFLTDGQLSIQNNSTTYLQFFHSSSNRFINGGASGSTIYFGAPASYTQNVNIQGTLDADNFKINGAQGSSGQVLQSTGSGVQWASVSSSGVTGSGSSGRVTYWNGTSSVTSNSGLTFTTSNGGRLQAPNFILPNNGDLLCTDSSGSARTLITMNANDNIEISNSALQSGSDTTVFFGDNFYIKGNNAEKMRVTDSLMYLGPSSDPALYVDTVNKKVGFRTTTPGSAFDVNGTFRARNELNIGQTTEQNFFVAGGSGPQYVKMGAYTKDANYLGISSSENLLKTTVGFGANGKVVQASRIYTTKITANGWPSAAGMANGIALTPTPGSNQIMYIRNIFVRKIAGSAGSGWSSGAYPIEFGWYTGSASRFIAGIPRSVVISTNPNAWYYQVTINAEDRNPYGPAFGPVANKPLLLNTPSVVGGTKPTYYIQVEYTLVNTSNLTTNVDQTL